MDKMEKLFRAYLVPHKYQDMGVGVSNNASKLAHYLSLDDPDLTSIISYDDVDKHHCQYFIPSCMAELPKIPH